MAERKISTLIALMIFLLTGINGIFTYSGALLYIGEIVYALLFAIAVQFAISISLISLPYVRGLGKPVLILVYIGATLLSTLSAYTYIYNAGRSSEDKSREITSVQVAEVIRTTALVLKLENDSLATKYQNLKKVKRDVEEEALRGLKSGMGAGKGRVYYQKLEVLNEQTVKFDQQTAKNQKLNELMNLIETEIEKGKRESLQIHISKIQSYTNLKQSFNELEVLKKEVLNETKNPIQIALLTLKNYQPENIQLIVSLVWAAVFDLIALFLGIVRYYILRPNYSIFSAIYDSVLNFYLFFIHLSYAKKEARLKHKLKVKSDLMSTPVNSAEIQNFASYLIAGTNHIYQDEKKMDNIAAYLLQNMEPLFLEGIENAVGIRMDLLKKMPKIKPLVAMLIQSEVFLEDAINKVLVLNSSSEMAQKVLIFLKLGLNNSEHEGDLKLQLEAIT